MSVFRPAGGFKIIVKPDVATYVDAECCDNPRVRQLWTDVLERASRTVLKEGTPISPKSPPTFLLETLNLPELGYPSITLICSCFGDTMTVTSAIIGNES
jgi:hypothetical protein